jgi:hypothetical protein
MARVSLTDAKKGPTYSPDKNYEWEPEDTFELSGVEFSTLLNTTRAMMNCLSILENLLKAGIEAGVIHEKIDGEQVLPPNGQQDNPGPIRSNEIIEGIELP